MPGWREDCTAYTFSAILAARANQFGEKVFLTYVQDRRQFSYAEMHRLSNRLANGLIARGIGKGTHVSMLMQNSPEQLLTYFALGKIGAVVVPINTAARGDLLSYYVNHSDSSAMVADQELLPLVDFSACPQVTDVVAFREEGSIAIAAKSRVRYHRFEEVMTGADSTPVVPVEFSDIAALMYTSGTTGPSKGNIFSQIHSLNFATPLIDALNYNTDDVYFVPLPLFHVASFNHAVLVMLIVGGSVVLSRRLSVTQFWKDVSESRATRAMLMSVGEFLLQQPPSPLDRAHCLRTATAVPMVADVQGFERRFGARLVQAYGLTDCCLPLSHTLEDPIEKRASMGRVMPGCQIRLVDDLDRDVPAGSTGEIVVRKDDMPYAVTGGYYKMPDATVQATRNLWFHTGDRARVDDDGYFYFVDRKKDAIRRHGENISSFEVEALVAKHSAVAEVAAYPVQVEGLEDEIGISVVLRSVDLITAQGLFEHCAIAMPHYMIPRFVDLRTELPKTATQKVRKQELRDYVVNHLDEIWDCQRHGFTRARMSPTHCSGPSSDSQ